MLFEKEIEQRKSSFFQEHFTIEDFLKDDTSDDSKEKETL